MKTISCKLYALIFALLTSACASTNLPVIPLSHQKIDFIGSPEGAKIQIVYMDTGETSETCSLPCQLEIDLSRKFTRNITHPEYLSMIEQTAYNANMSYIETIPIKLKTEPRLISIEEIYSDGDYIFPQTISRKPPNKIANLERSGHCNLIYGVTVDGRADDIRIRDCSEAYFKEESIRTVEQWLFTPATKNGEPFYFAPVHSKIIF